MSNPVSNPRSGLGWAVLGSWVGGGLSLAANIGQSLIRPDNVPVGSWQVDGWNVGIGVAAPLVLFIALEIIIKPQWFRATRAARLLVWLGFLPIALGAGTVSYDHMYELLMYKHQPLFVCIVLPLMPDGLMVMSTVAQRFIRRLTVTSISAATAAPTSVTVEPSTSERSKVVAPRSVPAAPAVAPAATGKRSPEAKPARPRAAKATKSPDQQPARSATASAAASRTDTPVTASTRATQLELPIDTGLLARAMKFASEYRAKTGKPITSRELSYRLQVPMPRAAALLQRPEFHDPTPISHVNGSAAV